MKKDRKIFPTIIHTAVIGSIERYLFTVLDHCALMEAKGQQTFITIMARTQPSTPNSRKTRPNRIHHLPWRRNLLNIKVRADIDDRDESLDKRVREAERNWIPYIVVVGQREIATGTFAVRRRQDGAKYETSLTELEKEITELTKTYPSMPLETAITSQQKTWIQTTLNLQIVKAYMPTRR